MVVVVPYLIKSRVIFQEAFSLAFHATFGSTTRVQFKLTMDVLFMNKLIPMTDKYCLDTGDGQTTRHERDTVAN